MLTIVKRTAISSGIAALNIFKRLSRRQPSFLRPNTALARTSITTAEPNTGMDPVRLAIFGCWFHLCFSPETQVPEPKAEESDWNTCLGSSRAQASDRAP